MKLGISIYPEIAGVAATKAYIALAAKYGFTIIFSNLIGLTNDAAGKQKLAEQSATYKFAQEHGFSVIVDVNPELYEAFKLPPNEIEFFRNINANGIRLDEDFKGVVEAELSLNKYGIKVVLNASAGAETFRNAQKHQANMNNIIAAHNFYPMRYTGLDFERFLYLSTIYQENGISTMACLTLPPANRGLGPWDVNDGMPTIERHRDLELTDQVLDFLQMGVIDILLIAQQGATESQLQAVAKLIKQSEQLAAQSLITLGVNLVDPANQTIECDIALNNKGRHHNNRPDYSAFFIRSSFPRITYKDEIIKPRNAGHVLKPGDVVVLNENLGRYKGELHIIKAPIDDRKEKARNLIGSVIPTDRWKIPLIKGGKEFKLNNESN